MRLKKGVHPLRLLSLLALLGLLSLWDQRFSWFLCFGAFASVDKWRVDERMSQNVARAARNSFFAGMLALLALNIVASVRPDRSIGGAPLMGLLLGLWLFFSANLAYYERRGD